MSNPTYLDRLLDSFRRLVAVETAKSFFYGTYEYTIHATNGTTVDASPNDTSIGLPEINSVEIRSDSLAEQVPKIGNLCHIIFVNGDATKPKCSWTQPDAVSATLLGGKQPIARQGDSTSSQLPAGMMFNVSVVPGPNTTLANGGGPVLGTALFQVLGLTTVPPGIPPTKPITGIVITGSPKVKT